MHLWKVLFSAIKPFKPNTERNEIRTRRFSHSRETKIRFSKTVNFKKFSITAFPFGNSVHHRIQIIDGFYGLISFISACFLLQLMLSGKHCCSFLSI